VLVYLSTYVAAILEGEVFYIAMCIAAGAGKANWVAVWLAGALGGSTGDNIWFYLLRGRINWLDRYPWLAKRRDAVVARVKAHETLMLLISRFPPGLRIAIPVACAYAGVRPLRFSTLNLISGLAWAGSIMLVIIKVGPNALSALGLNAWWSPAIPALFVFLFFRWLARPPKEIQN
jgi:membrane protein DedA with SNARE-associated domain